jgi:hypothetical protein
LNEHIDFKWLTAEELPHLDLAAADIPICFGDLLNRILNLCNVLIFSFLIISFVQNF